MLVVAIVAIFQTAIIELVVTAQRDGAHIIDISGAQRMRTQELAYLALCLRTKTAEPNVVGQIDTTIARLLATRAEILSEPQYDIGPRDRNGLTSIARLGASYVAAIRRVERDPSDAAAFAAVVRQRPSVFGAFDDAVEKRVAIVNEHQRRLVGGLLLGLLFQIASIVCVWLSIVAPAERRNRRLLTELRNAREEIESTFAGNPDGIAVFDRTGRLIRANQSRADFAGTSVDGIVGRHLAELIGPAKLEATRDAFERALRGEIVRDEIQLLASDGSLVDVSVTIFPRTVDDVATGVNVVSKDMRKLRAAEASNREQMRRITDLYEIASAYGRTTEELLNSAIQLVAARLGYDYGVMTSISDDLVTIVTTCGDPEGFAVGDVRPLKTSLARLAVEAPSHYETRDFLATPYATPAIRELGWKSVIGMKISVAGILYGTVGFANRERRESDLSQADIDFMRLACALLGTIMERGRQITRLDSLAFTDALTALPNRTRFAKRLSESIESTIPFALHYIDLDRFKTINDRFGHAVGDEVLRITAERLLHCTRASDMVVRLGGDEFAIVQGGPADREGATLIAERIVKAFGQPIELDGTALDVGASVGIAIYPTNGADARELTEAADAALYRAKHAGRRRYEFAKPADASSVA